MKSLAVLAVLVTGALATCCITAGAARIPDEILTSTNFAAALALQFKDYYDLPLCIDSPTAAMCQSVQGGTITFRATGGGGGDTFLDFHIDSNCAEISTIPIRMFPPNSFYDPMPIDHGIDPGIYLFPHERVQPKPVPPVTIEWGPCQEWEGEAASTATAKTIRGNHPEEIRKQFQSLQFESPGLMPWELPENPDREALCTRQLGFGSDGGVHWRDPRKQ